MPNQIQIYTDEKGNKTSVIVPYEDWAKINARLESLQNKLKIFFKRSRRNAGSKRGTQKKGKNLQDLSDFINESRS